MAIEWVKIGPPYVIAPRKILKVPRIRSSATIVGLAVALLLAACVPSGLPQVELAPQMRYLCRDGGTLQVDRSPDGRYAVAATRGQRARLLRMDSAAQEKYSDGATTLYLDGDQALLTSDSFVVAGPCIASQPLPVVQPWRPQ
jgi:membrane-bound inhibitor of C-type lysozyme